ncbi:PAS domain-containing protein [Pseudoduganella sp. SL102]|uniref:PAS domain-containing hybrid sensor histidine kinase/response regulator n=1 Tax=Pseudoduganella sp. SL102 TaxID=2995154 RepID=UPI00248C03E6|nr:ATP-binding protein [Pseudoduganella sp. SL102]WBS02443.1 PAS domain-containing protein [Pseudoduganella sp. SL102]
MPRTPAAFLAEGGAVGALMRGHDWSTSPLGPPEHWPLALRTVVGLMLNSAFPMFAAWGPQLAFLYNDAYVDVLGRKHPQALGRPFHEVWADIWHDISPIVDEAMAGRATYHENLLLTMHRKGYDEDTWFTFSYSPMRDEDGSVAGVFCACTETTEQVLSERHRAEEIGRMRRLFQQAPGILAVVLGPDHVFEIANDAYLRLVGRDDIVGRAVAEVLPEVRDQGFIALLDDVYRTGEPHVGHEMPVLLRRRPDSELEERFVNFIYQPIRDHRGTVSGIFVEGSDVTAAVLAMRALREANSRKDEFLAMLAHELRNPLAPIAAAAELLRLGTPDAARIDKTSAVITRQVEHMTKLVDDLLDVSRVTRGLVTLRRETLDFCAVVGEAVEQAAALMQAKRHRVTVELPDQRPWVNGDRTRLIQVLSNLLNNAARYTPDGGSVAVRVTADAREVRATVEDSGIGIGPGLLPQVFDLFTQAERSPDRSQGGLGLGLALAKTLIELQGGHVSAHSAGAGQGSRFTVCLPRAERPEAGVAGADAGEEPRGARRRHLMVVDDNVDAAQMLALLLEAAGHSVAVCNDAREALGAVVASPPALLFVDIGLPGMDGYELVRRLRQLPETARACIVAITGYGTPQDRARALEAGFDEHLVKPVHPKALYGILARLAAH